jgi:hypothetical protein
VNSFDMASNVTPLEWRVQGDKNLQPWLGSVLLAPLAIRKFKSSRKRRRNAASSHWKCEPDGAGDSCTGFSRSQAANLFLRGKIFLLILHQVKCGVGGV